MRSFIVKLVLFQFFWVITLTLVNAQTPYYMNYNVNQGLPSSQTYDSFEDSLGYMWFTSDRGIIKYDGYTFTTYTTEEGLASLVNFNFFKGEGDVFWVNGYDGSFSFWSGKKFVPFQYNWKLKKLFSDTKWFSIINMSETSISFFHYKEGVLPTEYFVIDKNSGEIEKYPYTEKTYVSKNTNDMIRFQLNHKENDRSFNTIFEVVDEENNLWEFTREGVLLHTKENKHKPRSYFESIPISSMYRNSYGNYWFTTLDRGLIYVPSFKISKLDISPNEDVSYKRLKVVDDILVAKLTEKPSSLFFENESNYFFSSLKNLKNKMRVFNIPVPQDKANQLHFKDEYTDNKIKLSNNLYCAFTNNFFRIYEYKRGKRIDKIAYQFKSFCAVEDYHQNLWIGGVDNLIKVDLGDDNPEPVKVPLFKNDSIKVRINDIALDQNGLWLGTLTKGLLYNSSGKTSKINHAKLYGKAIECLLVQNDTTLWAGTKKCLFKIRYHKKEGIPEIKDVQSFTTQDGLHDNSIRDIIYWKDHLYLATNRGISFFNPEENIKQKSVPKINFDSFLINGQEIDSLQSRYKLNFDENSIAIRYTGITLNKPIAPELFYRYKLNDEAWNYTNNRSVEFSHLPSKQYTFTVQCQNNNGTWSQPKKIQFQISPHFTELIGFKLVSTLIMIVLIFFSVRKGISISRKKMQKEINFKESELATLRNQINPHFVFNSLNTLQSYIFEGNVFDANEYIGDFASLMRKSLEFSKKSRITLDEEINFIENYLILEKRRFVGKFDYRIELSAISNEKGIYITPLITQPLVENAVKHAFKKRKSQENNMIVVKYLLRSNKAIQIEIIDNGSGFDYEKLMNNQEAYKSLGIQIIKQRIELINQKYRNVTSSFQYVKQEQGTKVQLILPILN